MTNLRFRINARYRNFRKKTMTSSGSVIDWADVFRLLHCIDYELDSFYSYTNLLHCCRLHVLEVCSFLSFELFTGYD